MKGMMTAGKSLHRDTLDFGVVWEHLHSEAEQLFHSVQTAVDQSEEVPVSWKSWKNFGQLS